MNRWIPALILLLTVSSLAPFGVPSVGISGGSHSAASAPSPAPTVASAHLPATAQSAASVPSGSTGGLLGVPGATTPTSMAYDTGIGFTLMVTPTRSATGLGSAEVGTWAYSAGNWTELSPTTAPSAREYASLTYDDALGQMILFGGYSPKGAYLSDTWGFTASGWTNLSSHSTLTPPARASAQIAYDAAGGFVVLYGGYGVNGAAGVGNLSDTWTFNASGWTQVATSVTPPVFGAMAYDANLSKVVYYGGVGLLGLCTSSTYEFNGTAWVDVSSSISGSPGGIALESMTYDPYYGGVVAFGGVCGLGIAGISLTLSSSNATWVLNGNRWTQAAAANAPPPSYGGDLVYEPSTGGVLLFGGIHPTLVGLGSITQQLSGGSYTCVSNRWSLLGPTLVSNGPLAETGMNVTVRVANLIDSGPSNFTYTNLPGPCNGQTGPSLVCRPMAVGTYRISVNVSMTLGLVGSALGVANASASLSIRIVMGMQIAPLTASLAVSEVGVPVTLSAAVSDGVNLSGYAYSGLPNGCASAAATVLLCTPASAGSFTIAFTATDSLGVRKTVTLPLQVAARTSVASFAFARSTIDLGMESNATTTIAGGVGPFNVAFSGLIAGCQSSSSGSIGCRPQSVGMFNLGVHVQDSLSVRANATTVLTVNPQPALRSLTWTATTVQIRQDSTLQLDLTGGTAPFTVVYVGLPPGCATANTTVLRCTPSASGNYTITATATDAVGVSVTASASLSVEVAPPTGGAGGHPATGLPPFAEGLASGAALFAVVVSAFLVRGRLQVREGERLARELQQGIDSEGSDLSEGPAATPRGPA
ncbi:MAG TPA: hypothetical protein VGX00_07770 [Thermoplasmata archaeon]|nr:hypothetical protein [Thermoplasmata archaeon]